MTHDALNFDPKLDLVLERVIETPPEKVWACWTNEKHIPHWFCPKPWSVSACVIDVRPGGACTTTLRSPDGQDFPNTGCYVVVEKPHRLVFTDMLIGDYRPKEGGFFTADLRFTPEGTGTRYTAVARHATEEARAKHEAMGFHIGWGIALDQLVEYAKGI